MARQIIRSSGIQASWTGDKNSMVTKHMNMLEVAHEKGAKIACFQELFYAPYFCQAKDMSFEFLAESTPNGPTTELIQSTAQRFGMVVIAPIYEVTDKAYYNTAIVINSDGEYLGKYRKTHIPNYENFWEKTYFQPGDLGFPVFETSFGKIGVCICYDRHFPEVARCLALKGAEIIFAPSATAGDDSRQLWFAEQVGHAAANGCWIATVNRVGKESFGSNDFFGSSYFVDPMGQIVAQANGVEDEVLIADIDLELVTAARENWQFFSNRRPSLYESICADWDDSRP